LLFFYCGQYGESLHVTYKA